MSPLPKISFTQKTGTAIIGITLFGALALTACAPAAQTNDSAPNPTAAASTEVPKGVQKFKTDAFDLSKQVSLELKKDDTKIVLGTGVVTQGKDGDKFTVSYTPFEGKDGAWKWTSDVRFGDNANKYVNLMRWQDKSYVVVNSQSEDSTEASGLTAAKKTETEHVTVLDAGTGKVVNKFDGKPLEVGASVPGTFLLDTEPSKVELGSGVSVTAPYFTGLTYHTAGASGPTQYKLVNPLTGQTVATSDTHSFNNESDFYEVRDFYATVGGEYEKTTVAGVFGNFALLATQQPETKNSSGAYIQNSKFSLVNTATKTVVSEMTCANAMYNTPTSYSPDFRYVSFLGNFAFDTKTGKSFCTVPVSNVNVRQFTVVSLDNAGNMYGTADEKEYMRISLADISKVETIAKVNSGKELPIRITEKGSAVFYSDNSEDVLVVVPAKTPAD